MCLNIEMGVVFPFTLELHMVQSCTGSYHVYIGESPGKISTSHFSTMACPRRTNLSGGACRNLTDPTIPCNVESITELSPLLAVLYHYNHTLYLFKYKLQVHSNLCLACEELAVIHFGSHKSKMKVKPINVKIEVACTRILLRPLILCEGRVSSGSYITEVTRAVGRTIAGLGEVKGHTLSSKLTDILSTWPTIHTSGTIENTLPPKTYPVLLDK